MPSTGGKHTDTESWAQLSQEVMDVNNLACEGWIYTSQENTFYFSSFWNSDHFQECFYTSCLMALNLLSDWLVTQHRQASDHCVSLRMLSFNLLQVNADGSLNLMHWFPTQQFIRVRDIVTSTRKAFMRDILSKLWILKITENHICATGMRFEWKKIHRFENISCSENTFFTND